MAGGGIGSWPRIEPYHRTTQSEIERGLRTKSAQARKDLRLRLVKLGVTSAPDGEACGDPRRVSSKNARSAQPRPRHGSSVLMRSHWLCYTARLWVIFESTAEPTGTLSNA